MASLEGQRVVVTGAGGFIGSHLAEMLLTLGAKVTALIHYDARSDRGNLEFLPADTLRKLDVVSGDICDPFFVQGLLDGADTVFHLAALIPIPYSYRAPASYVATNVQGTLNVLEGCRRGKVRRLVHTSTSETYGTAQHPTINENHPLQAQSPYAASKIGADKLAESYWRSMDLPVAVCRPFNTYGPRQSARAVIPTIFSQLLGGCTALRLGSLDPVRDFLFVEDTAAGFVAIALSDECIGKVTNLGTGRAVSVGQVVEMAMRLTGRQVPVITDSRRTRPEKSEVRALICDATAARDRAGWTPRFSLDDGLRRVAAFIAAHPDRYRPEEYAI